MRGCFCLDRCIKPAISIFNFTRRILQPDPARVDEGQDRAYVSDYKKGLTGISANELHKIFECGSNQPRRWSRIGAPRYVALALAAVLRGISPMVPVTAVTSH